MQPRRLTFYEFFAGGGMARAGLGAGWTCLFANDIDADKAASYRANWGGDDFFDGDLGAFAPKALPGQADLAWASFPLPGPFARRRRQGHGRGGRRGQDAQRRLLAVP